MRDAEDYSIGTGAEFGELPLFDEADLYDGWKAGVERAPEQVKVADLIWRHKGWRNAIAIAQITAVCSLSYRQVKAVVEELRKVHGCQIGARHDEPAGYFWIVNDEDRELAARPIVSQIEKMFRTLAVIGSRKKNLELLERMRGVV